MCTEERPCKTQGQGSHTGTRTRGPIRNWTCQDLDHGLLDSRTVRRDMLLFKSSSLWYFVMAAEADEYRHYYNKSYIFTHWLQAQVARGEKTITGIEEKTSAKSSSLNNRDRKLIIFTLTLGEEVRNSMLQACFGCCCLHWTWYQKKKKIKKKINTQ